MVLALTWDELEQIRGKRDWRIPIPPTCPTCHYILLGLAENRCPECGNTFRWSDVRRRAGRIWSAVNSLRHANKDAYMGLKIALGSLPAMFLAFVASHVTCIGPLLRLPVAFAALLSIVLGAQVMNIRRVPPWAREHITGEPPNLIVGLTAVALGLAVLIGAIGLWPS